MLKIGPKFFPSLTPSVSKVGLKILGNNLNGILGFFYHGMYQVPRWGAGFTLALKDEDDYPHLPDYHPRYLVSYPKRPGAAAEAAPVMR
jgi:hypothetical protein